jgi:hypothetical protein
MSPTLDSRSGVGQVGRGGRSHQPYRSRVSVTDADEQVGLVPDEVLLAVDRQLVVLAHEDRRDRARLLAVAAEDAPGLVDLVDRSVAGARLHRSVVLGRLQVDGVGRAGHRAEPAGHALLQAVLVAHQDLLAPVLGERGELLVRVVRGDLLPENVLQRRRKPYNQGADHRFVASVRDELSA